MKNKRGTKVRSSSKNKLNQVKKNQEVMRKETENEEEKKKKILFLLLLFLPAFFLFFTSVTVLLVPQVREEVEEKWVDTWRQDSPTAPIITGGGVDWAKKRIISVKKNAYSYYGIDYYEYCVTTEGSSKNCKFQRTDTKNTVVSMTGKYNVYFRGVSKKGTKGAISKKEVAYIDNNNPIIEKINIEDIKSTEVRLKIEAKDTESGVKDYFYRVNDGDWTKSKATIEIDKLKEKTKYEIEVKVTDQVGNETIGKMPIETLNKEGEEKDKEEEFKAPTYIVTPSNDKWSSYKIVEIIYPNGVEQEYSLDSGKTWKKYTGPIRFVEDGKIIGRSRKEKKVADAEELEIKFIDPEMPQIGLELVPEVIEETDKYNLPSSYKFGPSGGTKVCYTETKEEIQSTQNLGIGIHEITCVAKGNNGLTATVSKTIEVIAKEVDTTWDGWITMTLFYPSNSTDREWRLGDPNQIRPGTSNTSWNPYLGSITVKIEDVQNIYIRYKLNGETVTIPPAGRLLVDIEPKDYFVIKGNQTEVKINYDKTAEVKEYKIGNGPWQPYTGSFKVKEKTLVEARATKVEQIYDTDGTLMSKRKITGTDSVYIGEYIPAKDENTSTGTDNPTSGNGPSSGAGGSYPDIDYPENNKPSYHLGGPDIILNPGAITTGIVTATITPKEQYRDIYYKLGSNGTYQKYTTPVSITKNITIYAYYVRDSDGMTSAISTKIVNNIQIPGKPYVWVNADPYPYYGASLSKSVNVEIGGQDYQTLEYSFDGINYQLYTGIMTINNNCRIYAKATNAVGTTIETLDITNIGSNGVVNPPIKPQTLKVDIIANPDNPSTLIDETQIMIQYDSKSTNNTYRIGNGSLQAYTGPFKVNKNNLITAYAYNNNGKGQATKQIDFLTSGISAPLIVPNINNNKTSQSVILTIEYDKNAVKKQYKIDNGPYQTYTGPVTVTSNSIIEAYNENSLGQGNSSTYQVTNIVPLPPAVLIERDYYYLLKLNYPSMSKVREYKWTVGGVWKPYPEDGILLIKAGYKDKVLSGNNIKIKIEDDNGNEIDFGGDYYLVTEDFSKIMENLFMRWDTVKPEKPTIVPDTKEISKEVNIMINYPKDVISKEYRIVYNDGSMTGWNPYKGALTLNKNGTIYARGENEAGMSSDEASLKVENIDEEDPKIKITGDFDKVAKNVKVKVEATDDQEIEIVMWAKGKQGIDYFKDSGTVISNNSELTATENGYYSFYTRDKVGREIVVYQEIKNIDNIPPEVEIKVLTKEFGITANIEMLFGDAIIKEYKVGATAKTYKSYTGEITLSSYDVLDNNLQNNDKTVSIYARGVDSVGNEQIIEKKISILDLERPDTPVITVNGLGGYPVLTEYGVKTDLKTVVSFENLKENKNLYSIDNGTTWIEYKNEFDLPSNVTQIMAKTVKESTGLESKVATKIISNILPGDAIGPLAYDGNNSTQETLALNSNTSKYIVVDESMWGKKINIYGIFNTGLNDKVKIIFKTEKNSGVLSTNEYPRSYSLKNYVLTIPNETKYIQITSTYQNVGAKDDTYMNELTVINEPKITLTQEYPELNEYGVTSGYNTATIEYFQTSVQKLYRIGAEGEWKDYKEQKIRLNLGEILYAKGINKDGIETKIVSATTVLPSDAIGPLAYDGNNSTQETLALNSNTSKYIVVDESMWGKKINIYGIFNTGLNDKVKIIFKTEKNSGVLSTNEYPRSYSLKNYVLTIPNETKYIQITSTYQNVGAKDDTYMNELTVINEPKIAITQEYPELNAYEVTSEPKITINTKSWSQDKLITINYGNNNYQKQYSLDYGKTWLEYTTSIKVEENTTVLTRLMDKEECISSSSYKVTKIDNTVPTISLDLIPSSIKEGDTYSLPSDYHVETTKSGGTATCTINDIVYQTTTSLPIGKHIVLCTVTTGAGKTATATKELEIVSNKPPVVEENKIADEKPPASKEPVITEPTESE